ncbi:T9SS type B sorting domain-containing protein [Winogradskyella sp.]|uniref:T9SS type B sorting domain-containing protein n=1 Tax=Winogradskyella sp. TaxID=1883156 RepID=UPI0025DB7447|nr:T9SS type B sorting domain-containing protein [Winogradskyella sp.]
MSQQAIAQLSKTHYIPPLTSAEFGNANPENQYIYLSTPSAADVAYTIKQIGLPTTSDITGLVSNGSPQVINIGTGNGQLFVASNQTSTITSKGYVIEAEDVIYVSVRMQAGNNAQAGALVSKGASALGQEFRVGSFTNENPQDNYLNFVSIMATEDNTEVVFDNLPAGLVIKNYSGTTPVSITLDKHESYTIATNSLDTTINRDGLIGCLVTSNKDIVVNCGSANGSFHNGNGRDYGIDQIVGASKIGSEYIFVKGDGTNNWENILIVAHTDNTTVSINGSAPITTINAGDYYVIEGNNYNTNGNMYVETSEDVFAYQGVGATTSEANQGLFFVPPLSCEARGNLDNIANIENIGSTSYSGGVSIVTKVGATVTINNTPIADFGAIGPSAVTGNTEYVTYKVTGLTGNISVQSSDELYCAYFNFNGAATSGSFYSGFPSAPEINFNTEFVALGNCIPNITLSAANTQNFDSFEWLFDDGSGSGFVDLGISTPDLTPTNPGTYKLVGIVTCSGLVLESAEVPVSICPDDIDNDGIIDNLDIDNDNDGILNCEESNGNVTLDLSFLNQPQFIFDDGSIDDTLATGLYTQTSSSGNTNSFTGDNQGRITSTVNPANTAENEYSMSFSELVNVKFSEDTSTTHMITNGEYFTVKITPVNKNVTLQDLDNRLLVDSNFDGVFETGVTLISGSEIRFKINPSPTGTAPYEFFADKVSGFSIVHNLTNVTESSTFNGIISLSCYQLDTDADGIENALDLDSDNDGIPDYIESLGNNFLNLSGFDTNNDGLDDVYNSNAVPIDTDDDTIADYLDLDADNDGIHDLHESGQLGLLSDTDSNGVVDGPVMNFGANGWIDVAETSPDSGLISYTLNDFDTDSNFSYLDLDSDDDGCSDVVEAGFSDANTDDLLGDMVAIINSNGLVVNAFDGYTIPNSDYLDAAPITILTEPIDTDACEASDAVIFVVSDTTETFQWETSTDGINWLPITDDAIYSGTLSNELTISNTPLTFNGNLYRAKLNRTGNSCDFYSEDITLNVFALPQVNTPVTLVQCDDDNDGFSAFNLTEANTLISINSANENFSYYLTEIAAISGDELSSDYINDPTLFVNQNVSSGLVWARVVSQLGCVAVSEVQLQVSTTAIPSTFQRTFNRCDDFLDINGNDNTNNDDSDGIATFDFSSVTAEVLAFIPAGQNPLPPRYFRNEADALAEVNEITDISNYRNIGYPNTQQIYIRVDSAIANDCLGLGTHITLTVEELPVANSVTIEAQCDDDNDGLFPFNVSQVQSAVLNGQSLSDVNVTYFNEAGMALPSPLPNPFVTGNQTITIRVTNNVTADPNGACFDETTLEFEVYDSPIANPVTIAPVCDNDADDTDGLFSFDTSSIQNDILQGQVGMEVHYFNSAGEELSSPLPNPLVSGTQTITATVINPLNESCVDSTDLEFVVNTLPDFTVETPLIVCSSDPTFTVVLDPIEADSSENFSYEWVYQDGTLLSMATILEVSTPGTYTVTLTKTDGTGCSRSRNVFVDASELATITLDDITVRDFSDNNTITINNTNNNLGLGEYEFALDNEFNYQDEPFFSNVTPGFHTLYVRDKNGCGTVNIEIPVIGYPKYFTPNGDGVNDRWQLKGISSNYQARSMIYIFNRYGKLLHQFQALNGGWDGTYNGLNLPTSDYWFRVVLEDGRQFSGHFTLKR